MDQLPFPAAGDILTPAPRYGELQEREPVARVRTATGGLAWLVTRHADVTALLGDDRLGRSHPDPARAATVSGSVLLGGPVGDHDTERDRHRQMRQLLGPAFSARRMNALRPRIGQLVERLLDELPSPPTDWHRAFSVPLPVMAICELLGIPYEDHPRFRGWAGDLTSLTDATRAAAARTELIAYVRSLLPAKRDSPGEGMVSDLVERGLADDAIAQMAAMLLFAGHETTVVRLDLGLLLLLANRDQLDALRLDATLVQGAVEEILRLSSSTTTGGLPRYARTDLVVRDVPIAAGDAIVLAAHAANRDRRVFDDPDFFDLTRPAKPHLSFGHGAHYCIGAALARVELQEAFGRIAARLPGLRLAIPRSELRVHVDRLTGGLAGLPVTW
ncbi:cytochrome P450 [Actinoplanes subtropicus]|uniref:cytochrome P450 n=1 Tax=Actinoplanes subtropicus TaxID=543632 RepID=UPI0004C35432|nr:cytochrome P450 [Actinoplanes subtropicus]